MGIRKDARSRLKNNGGFWERDPSTMNDFCGEPTADGDTSAMYLREWYEANRETWLQRHGIYGVGLYSEVADDFMLAMLIQVGVIDKARADFLSTLSKREDM